MENWKVIPEFEQYEVSDLGNVRRRVAAKTRKALTPLSPVISCGYLRVCLRVDGKAWFRFVHRLVMRAFVGELPEGKVVAHNDNNPFNNKLTNLRYATPTENVSDMRANGTHPAGEKNGNAVLSARDVLFIKATYRRYSRTHGSGPLAKQFGVSNACRHR